MELALASPESLQGGCETIANPARVKDVLNQIIDRRCVVTVHREDDAGAYLSALLDFRKRETLLILDDLLASPEPLFNGERIRVEAKLDGRMLIFHTRVVKRQQTTRGPFYLINVPLSIFDRQRRRAPRIPVPLNMPLAVAIANPEHTVSGELRDLSITGLSFRVSRGPIADLETTGTDCICAIALGADDRITTQATIRRIERSSARQAPRVGMQFAPLTNDDQDRVMETMRMLQRAA